MFVHLIRGAQHWKRVHKSKQLNLERLVLHGPLHEFVRPKLRAKHARLVAARARQNVRALGLDQCLKNWIGAGRNMKCGGNFWTTLGK